MTTEAVPLPLSEPGPYYPGTRGYEFQDTNRNNRRVILSIYYPAIKPEGATGTGPKRKAIADTSGAPYPIILSSAKAADLFGPHLASFGFVVVGINGQDASDHWGRWLLDFPLDIVFALDQIAVTPLEGLEGILDSDHAGAMGYSFDGYNSLALGGARIDPDYYRSQCNNAATLNPTPPKWWSDYICNMTGGWDEFVTYAGMLGVSTTDGLWQPITDERIRAVMPMAPEGAWLFGERGLEAVDRPTLIIGATADDINIYDLEAVYIFEHLGTSDRIMISFVDQGHMMISDPDQVARMKHFAVVFFGYHLQGQDEYAKYFSEEFFDQYNDLRLGVVER
jgi:predicted dienelactone hydrolase